ncbi:hypothetical protein ACQP2E_09690 [Actinoplanes sp. CA-015351]|uniref:hypothetical protein n=1 Tax=Actinoplanes sp. CA-015351 TaxID=3239897 RepID=UPI003D98AD45
MLVPLLFVLLLFALLLFVPLLASVASLFVQPARPLRANAAATAATTAERVRRDGATVSIIFLSARDRPLVAARTRLVPETSDNLSRDHQHPRKPAVDQGRLNATAAATYSRQP